MDKQFKNFVLKIKQDFPEIIPSILGYEFLRDIDYNVNKRLADNIQKQSDFSFLPVEDLINETCIILDRCLSLRTAKQELEIQAMTFFVDNNLFYEQAKIIDKQIEAGLFTIPSKVAEKQESMEGNNLNKAINISEKQQEYLDMLDKNKGKEEYKNREYLSGEVAYTQAVNRKEKAETLAHQLVENTAKYEFTSYASTKLNNEISINSHLYLKDIAAITKDFEKENEVYKQKLLELTRQSKDYLVKLATQPGIGLNYKERLIEIQNLFDRDFLSAYKRLEAIEKGLALIYGINKKLPPLVDEKPLVSLILWLRDCIDDLAILTDRQINFQYVISIKDMISEQQWKELCANKKEIEFNVNDECLKIFSLLRIHSINIVIEDGIQTGDGWRIMLQMPPISTEVLPPLFFGNVASRKIENDKSSCYGRTIKNASPVGVWKIKILGNSRPDISSAEIKKIELTFGLLAMVIK